MYLFVYLCFFLENGSIIFSGKFVSWDILALKTI